MNQSNVCVLHNLPLEYTLFMDDVPFKDVCRRCAKAKYTTKSKSEAEFERRTAQINIFKEALKKFVDFQKECTLNPEAFESEGKSLHHKVKLGCEEIAHQISQLEEKILNFEEQEAFDKMIQETKIIVNRTKQDYLMYVQYQMSIQKRFIQMYNHCLEMLDSMKLK